MAIETYKGIQIPTEFTDTINQPGSVQPGGIIIENDMALADRVTDIENHPGTKWYTGTGEPFSSLNPNEDDFYLEDNGTVWQYSTENNVAAWREVADLTGPTGAAGSAPQVFSQPTSTGTNLIVTSGGTSVTIPIANGANGISPTVSVTDTEDGHVITFTSGNVSTSFTLYDGIDGQNGTSGQDGRDGTQIFTGTVVGGDSGNISASVSGSKTGDLYINTSSGNLYIAVAADTWNYLFRVKGVDGAAGQNGQNGQTGASGADGFTPTITLGTKVNGSQTLTITNKTGSTTTTINDGMTGWNEATLTDSTTTTLSDGDSVYSSLSMSAVTITTSSGWSVGHTARVGVTFAASSTFSYPSTWIAIGDDCSGGDFTFSQGSSYWLNMECKPDGTWMTVIKVPS